MTLKYMFNICLDCNGKVTNKINSIFIEYGEKDTNHGDKYRDESKIQVLVIAKDITEFTKKI